MACLPFLRAIVAARGRLRTARACLQLRSLRDTPQINSHSRALAQRRTRVPLPERAAAMHRQAAAWREEMQQRVESARAEEVKAAPQINEVPARAPPACAHALLTTAAPRDTGGYV